MKGEAKVIEMLNEALKHELAAVNQYWLHYRLLEEWGIGKLAAKEREESIEEMRHADDLIARIIFLEGFPNLQVVAPLMIGESVREVLDCDLRAEYAARNLYREARTLSHDLGDFVTMQLFEKLLADEEGHIDFLETQVDLFDKIGAERYAQLNASKANED